MHFESYDLRKIFAPSVSMATTSASNSSLLMTPVFAGGDPLASGLSDTPTGRVLQCLVIAGIWSVSFVGNSLVCIVVHRSRRLQSTTNCFVVSLACSDLVVTCVVLPLLFVQSVHGRWPFGTFVCKLLRTLMNLVPGSTMFVLVSICVDRFYTTVLPLSFKVTRSRAKQLCAASWCIAALISIPSWYFYSTTQNHCRPIIVSNQWPAMAYSTFVVVSFVISPIGAMCYGYFKVFRYLCIFTNSSKHRSVTGINGESSTSGTTRIPRLKAKMITMIMITSTVTSVCVVLFYAPLILHWSLGSSALLLELSVVVYFVSAALKPCLYAVYNVNFRRGAVEVFCSSTLKCYRSNLYSITTTSQIGKRNHVGTLMPSLNHETVNHSQSSSKPRPPLIPLPRLPVETSISLLSSFNSEQPSSNSWI